jgi:hypothetical protein
VADLHARGFSFVAVSNTELMFFQAATTIAMGAREEHARLRT